MAKTRVALKSGVVLETTSIITEVKQHALTGVLTGIKWANQPGEELLYLHLEDVSAIVVSTRPNEEEEA